ncbi:MAG: hypothetical protein UV30_C0006G0017 [Candidatus Collierbacteria bacterium GW2011_GWF1_42_50]|nr:MAG: hypothetical protein UV30_C0006G0017 [Candidatus Collierbacteria bacterium GW2011_GWF1_42_50]
MEKRGHALIPSASLVPEGDATTLFIYLVKNILWARVLLILKNVSAPETSMK